MGKKGSGQEIRVRGRQKNDVIRPSDQMDSQGFQFFDLNSGATLFSSHIIQFHFDPMGWKYGVVQYQTFMTDVSPSSLT